MGDGGSAFAADDVGDTISGGNGSRDRETRVTGSDGPDQAAKDVVLDDPGRDALFDDALFDDERLTLMGLFAESWSGLARQIEQRLRDDCGLPGLWFVLLLRIARSPDRRLRMSDLAGQTGLSPSGLTRAIDRLEGVGYVKRAACPSDRRGAFAALTAEGLETITAAVGPHLQHVDELLLSVLSRREQDELATILRKIRDHVNPTASFASQPEAARRSPQ